MSFFRKIVYKIPGLIPAYHFSLAFLGAFFYGFPSRKLSVIGVTGTKGKTTTSNLITEILNSSGKRTGMATTVNFRIGEREWVNDKKQTMLGRFALQKLLYEMKKEGCEYAVVETSSEGIKQFRHKFINYKIGVFTNLSPEHIDRHGSFASYRAAKAKLFEFIARRKDGVGIFNLNDENTPYFLDPKIAKTYGYAIENLPKKPDLPIDKVLEVRNIALGRAKTEFEMGGIKFEMPLVGLFNVSNAAAAITLGLSEGIAPEKIKEILRTVKPVPGRMEAIPNGKDITVIVDYAHEPASLSAVYQAIKIYDPKKIIGILGSQGGGRDNWKRKEMGKIAAGFCDVLILTNEDPYDEDPQKIIDDVERGALEVKKKDLEIEKIMDREEAIKKALSIASKGDAVVITGKGGEVLMCLANGKKIPWSDRKIVEEALNF